jgi:hypothetical protein
LNDTQKKIEDTILKLEQRLKFAKTPEQWDNIKDRIERLQAGLNRSKQGVAEGGCNATMEGEMCPEHGLAECGMHESQVSESQEGDALLARIKSLALLR